MNLPKCVAVPGVNRIEPVRKPLWPSWIIPVHGSGAFRFVTIPAPPKVASIRPNGPSAASTDALLTLVLYEPTGSVNE